MSRHIETEKEKAIRILTALRAYYVGELIPQIRRKKKWKPSEKVSAIYDCNEVGEALKYVIKKLKDAP